MCNSSDDNTFEHFLIKQNIYNLKEKKYEKLLAEAAKRLTDWQTEGLADANDLADPWFDICLELGQSAWICPGCRMMYVFDAKGKVKQTYQPVENAR